MNLMYLNLMVPEYLINVSKICVHVCKVFDCPHAPPQHFSTSGEECRNVASILLQLAHRDLESSFDCTALSKLAAHVLDICPLTVL